MYNRWLQKSNIPKLLIYGEPGILVPKPVVDWCMQNLSNLKAVNIGPGIHLLQEDNPHFIGQEIVKWYDENNLGLTASHFRKSESYC